MIFSQRLILFFCIQILFFISIYARQSSGKNNGKDDDGDGNIDEEDETVAFVQDTTATVIVRNLNSEVETEFQYVALADSSNSYDDEGEINFVPYGGYKPIPANFKIESYGQYQIEIYSREFDKTITGITTVYPAVDFIDTLHTFQDSMVLISSEERKQIFWKSDLEVTAYYITYEESEQIQDSGWEFVLSYPAVRDNDLSEKYTNVSIGRGTIFGGNFDGVLRFTVEAFSPEYGRYIFSELPLKDPQRSNLHDEDGNPVMGCFGAIAAKSIFIVIEE